MADRNALARATDQSSSPTPGYLYNDIAKQTAASPSIASETLTYLIRRLAKNNPQVKYKALKTIAMVSTNPNSRGVFKRTVMQDHNAMRDIKDCLNYRGKSDAVHGDQLSERVRTQAKETLDYVYSEDHPSQSQSNSGIGGGGGMSSGGYGAPSSGYGGGGGGGYGSSNGGYGAGNNSHNNGGGMPVPSGPKRMEGIGNPMFKDPRLEAGANKTISEMTVTDVMQTAKEGLSVAKSGFVGILKDPLARNTAASSAPGGMNGPRVGGMGGGYGGNGGGGYGGGGYGAPRASQSSWNAPPGQAQLASSTNGQWTMASNRGPNAISSQDTYRGGGNNVSSGIGGSWGGSGSGGGSSVAAQARTPQFNTNNHNPVVNISGHPGAANTSGTFEKNLIMELCPPGGMKPEPPADKLQSFCQSLPDLNSDLVCPALLDMLEDGQPWIIRAKVLCVMERCVQVGDEMVRNNAGVESNAYADFFHMCSEEIKPLANHSRSAVRMPARRVLKVLGLDAPSDNVAAQPPQAVAPKMPVAAAPAPNLLDFDEAPAVPAGPPPPVPSEAPPAPAAVPPPVPDMAPPAPPTASGGDMFGGMTMKSTPAPAPAPVPTPAPAPTPAVEHDLFGVVDVKPTPTSTPAPAAPSMFGDMVVKSTTADVSSVATDAGKENVDNGAQPSADAPAGGSGFSFLNAGGAAPASQPQKAEAPKQSFDPLLNAPAPQQQQSPAMANMSPQMAAVMQQQQQQILMMQAQMQQMQMGVAGAGGQRMVPGMGVAQMQQMQMGLSGAGGQRMVPGVNMNMGGNQPPRMGVMGGMGGSGVSTSFAFMEDPSKVKKEETNKKFDFVMDAMNGAK